MNFDFITLPFKNKLNRLRFESAQIGLAKTMLSEANRLVADDHDAERWTPIGAENGDQSLSPEERATMQTQAKILARLNPHAKGVLRNAKKYVIGKGIVVTSQDSNPDVQTAWDKFWKDNKMDRRQKQIVYRTFRDGEVFLRYFKGTEAFDGDIKVRFIPANQIKNTGLKDEDNGFVDGIKTDPDDAETPIEYQRVWTDLKGKEQTEVIPAEEIQHIKILIDEEEKRGLSFLLANMQDFTYYRRWLKDRIVLNKVRSAIVMVKKVKGGPASVQSIADNIQNKNTDPAMTSKRSYKSGSTIVANEAVDYEFKTPNLQAQDTKADGREIKLSIAAGTSQPEYMQGDASNANFASTMVSESPFIRDTEDWQDFFEFEFQLMYETVISHKVELTQLPATSKETVIENGEEIERECDTKTSADIEWPQFTHRNVKEETEALILQRGEGVLSPQTMSARLDLEAEEEQRLIKKWDEEHADQEKDEFEKEREKALKDEEDEIERLRKQKEEEEEVE